MDEFERGASFLDQQAERLANTSANLPTLVPLADVLRYEPPKPKFWIDALLPERVVTLLGAHGGTGKTTLAAIAAVCLCFGRSFMGKATRRARVVFYSAEDPKEVLLWQFSRICRHMGIDPAQLDGRLMLLDATDIDPVLFTEINDAGIKHGITTGLYDHLQSFDAEVFVIDNASDTYDAGENERPRVRGFIRALAKLVKARAGAVLLLAHIDKSAARGFSSAEGYSGSTAWHNSVRSRLFLSEQDGDLVLEHQKSNYGPKAEPIRMQWNQDGVPQLVGADAAVLGLVASADRDAVAAMIREFYGRGEYLPTSPNAQGNAYRTLKDEPGFPKRMDRSKFNRVMRDAERFKLIERETYVKPNRHQGERWRPVAPSAPSPRQVKPDTTERTGAPSAPSARGVWGERARTEADAGGA